jgi:hypothetical protein
MRLLYFSPVPARSYAQRPHFMVQAWLEWGAESVLWVDPYPCRLPQWGDLRRGRMPQQATPQDPRVSVLGVPALPLEPLRAGRWLNRLLTRNAWRQIEEFAAAGPLMVGIGRPCDLALTALKRLCPVGSFFDAMDNFPEFYHGLSRRAMQRSEDAVAAEVDVVLASSTFLADKFARRGLRVEKVLNACDVAKVEGGRGKGEENYSPPPSPFPLPPSPLPPTLGYLGCLGYWFDWPLVVRLAQAVPQAQIELVGPCAVSPPRRLPANVRLRPACEQREVAGHLARFSAGLIPFQASALTAAVDPIKYYEYRAIGLPVLSTRFGEMTLRGRPDGVYFLDRDDDLAGTVAEALRHQTDPAETNRFRQDNNWAWRFSRCLRLETLRGPSPARRAA